MWLPVSHDGIFFKENAKERYLRHDVPTNITYIIGTNSFEGSLLYGYPDFYKTESINFSKIKKVFDLLEGYSEGKETLNYR